MREASIRLTGDAESNNRRIREYVDSNELVRALSYRPDSLTIYFCKSTGDIKRIDDDRGEYPTMSIARVRLRLDPDTSRLDLPFETSVDSKGRKEFITWILTSFPGCHLLFDP